MVKPAKHAWQQLLRRLPFSRLAWDRSAVSAVEFALILPLMLTLYIGGVQVSQALSVNRKVAHVTETLADLVTQSKSLTNSDMTNIFEASSSVMAPYASDPLQITVAQIQIDANSRAKVVWSDARNATAPTVGSIVTLPTAIAVANSFVVATVAKYAFTPVIGYVLTGSFTLSSTYYLRPRLTDCISRPSAYTCS